MNSLPPKVVEHEKYIFRLSLPSGVREVGHDELSDFANLVGLTKNINGRFSWQFAMDLFALLEVEGIDPAYIVTEIRHLEEGTQSRTKPEEEFKHPPLRGLWHKHFFSARFLPANIAIEHGKKGVAKILASKNLSVQTEEDARLLSIEIAREIVTGAFEQRSERQALTGEWIVFAKHDGQNYYLRACKHSDPSNDQKLYNEIEQACFRQFPFLKS